jgi:hypothetical protein
MPGGTRSWGVVSASSGTRNHKATRRVATEHAASCLGWRLHGALGQTLQDYVTRHNSASSRLHSVLQSVHLKVDGTIEAKVAAKGGEGATESIRAKTLVLALGGYQDFAQSCLMEFYPGVSLRPF